MHFVGVIFDQSDWPSEVEMSEPDEAPRTLTLCDGDVKACASSSQSVLVVTPTRKPLQRGSTSGEHVDLCGAESNNEEHHEVHVKRQINFCRT